MKRIFTVYAIIIVVMFMGSMALALSLQEAKEQALINNIDIKISEENLIQTHLLSRSRYTNLFPELILNSKGSLETKNSSIKVDQGLYGTFPFGPIPFNDVEIDVTRKRSYSLNLMVQQPVFSGGKIYFSYHESKSLAEEAEWNKKQTIQDTILNVEKAYFNLLKSEEIQDYAREHENTLKAHLEDMEKRYKEGRAALNDLLKIKVELSEARLDIVKAKNDVAAAERQINLILARPLDQPIDAFPLEKPKPLRITLEEAENLARANNQALNKARAKRETAIFQRRITESEYYPDIVLTAGYSAQNRQQSFPDNQWSVIMSMDWPFWQWGETDHKVDAAISYERQMDYYISSLENQIIADVRDIFIQVTEADQRVIMDKEEIIQAEENNRVTQIGFANGRKTLTDVLEAEELLSKMLSSYVQDNYDAHIARSQLRYIIGRMEIEDL